MSFGQRHWTDDAATPVFETRIPRGNIFSMVGTASRLMRELEIPSDRIAKLQEDVMSSENYDQACAFIEAWFPTQ